MRELTKDFLFSAFLGLLFPGLLLNFAAMVWDRAIQSQEEQTVCEVHAVTLPVKIRSLDGTVTEMDMDTYLVGVLLAEMPASFALRASTGATPEPVPPPSPTTMTSRRASRSRSVATKPGRMSVKSMGRCCRCANWDRAWM